VPSLFGTGSYSFLLRRWWLCVVPLFFSVFDPGLRGLCSVFLFDTGVSWWWFGAGMAGSVLVGRIWYG
jgi:hypothetical protein